MDKASQKALIFYLKEYLEFLSNAGHHIFFSLPDFDDDNYSVFIDFSAASQTTELVEKVNGVSIHKINTFLSTAWLTAGLLANTQNDKSDKKIALAEYSGTISKNASDIRFTVKFGAPHVKALCNQEVILYFNIEKLCTYASGEFTKCVVFDIHFCAEISTHMCLQGILTMFLRTT